jgi:hypothetical protein
MHRMLRVLVLIAVVFSSSSLSAQIGIHPARLAPPEDRPGATRKLLLDLRGSGKEEECHVDLGFFPTKGSGEKSLCFWNQRKQEYLKYGSFVSTEKSIATSAEVLSDAFGGTRLALSTAVSASTGSDENGTTSSGATAAQDRTLSLLAANGGNLALTLSYPIYYGRIANGTFLWSSYGRAAANLAAFGGTTTETTIKTSEVNGNVELALSEFRADLLSYEKKFDVLVYAKLSRVIGTSKFGTAIGSTGPSSFNHRVVGIGLVIGDLVTVYVTRNHYPSDVPGSATTLTVSLGK